MVSKKDKAEADKGSSGDRSTEDKQLQLLRALAHPIRLHLMGVLSDQDISPAEFARLRGETVSHVSYHFRVLEELDCVEVVSTRPVRGSTEHFYRRTANVVFEDDMWPLMSDEARRIVASTILRDLVGRVTQAVQAGTFTARDDAHITWTPAWVDEKGWGELIAILARAFREVTKVEVKAAERMAESGEKGILATLAFLGFESPSRVGQDEASG